MIDLHCHLLPGVDDGPDTLAESLALCRVAVEDGISHAIVTPHIHPGRWDNTATTIQAQCRALSKVLVEESIQLNLGFAAEVRLTDQLIEQVTNQEIPFYGVLDGYRVMLLEFPHGSIVPGSEQLVAWLLNQNIRPLIAHPERNRQIMRAPDVLLPFIEAGCLMQLTAGSLTGGFGEKVRQTAVGFLREGFVDVIATDGHNLKVRPPKLSEAYQSVANMLGESHCIDMFVDLPRKIIASQFP